MNWIGTEPLLGQSWEEEYLMLHSGTFGGPVALEAARRTTLVLWFRLLIGCDINSLYHGNRLIEKGEKK